MDDAKRCLRGKHALFFGDSLTRHQFEALVIWLHTGTRAIPTGTDPRPRTPLLSVGHKTVHDAYGCDKIMRCEVVPGDRDLRLNMYYHDAEYDFNVTMLGVYYVSNAGGPLGWLPNLTAAFNASWGWRELPMEDVPAALAQWTPFKFDHAVLNAGLWAHRSAWLAPYVHGPIEDAVARLQPWERVMKQVRNASCCVLRTILGVLSSTAAVDKVLVLANFAEVMAVVESEYAVHERCTLPVTKY